MNSEERVLSTINLQPADHVPCGVDLSYFVARHYHVPMAEYLSDMALQMDLQHKAFDELNGVDYVHPFPSRTVMNRMAAFTFMPMKIKLPGKELSPDAMPQYDETEVIPLEGYDIVLEKGWERYSRENLIPKYFCDQKELELNYDEESDHAFFAARKAYYPYLGFPALLPFELFNFGRSLGKFSLDLYRCPDKLIKAMDAVAPELLNKAITGIRSPGSPVLMPASRCSNGFISNKQFEKFVLPYLLKFVAAIVEKGSPVFFHLDQTWTRFLPYFKQLPPGRYVLHFDGTTDMLQAKRILGDRVCLMGDVPARLFKLGNPESVQDYCRKLIDTIGKGGGYIISAGCGVPPDAKFENVQAMIETAKNYRPA